MVVVNNGDKKVMVQRVITKMKPMTLNMMKKQLQIENLWK